MRVSITHNKSKEEVIQTVDRSFDDLFRGTGGLPVRLVPQHRNWQGSTLHFAMNASMGFLSSPIKGTVEVTDHEIILDVDLGVLERMIPAKTAHEMISEKVKGLLS